MAKRSAPFTVVDGQDDEGYFFANVPELRGCHTHAKSLDVLMKRVVEAITFCPAEGPRPARRTFVGVQQVFSTFRTRLVIIAGVELPQNCAALCGAIASKDERSALMCAASSS